MNASKHTKALTLFTRVNKLGLQYDLRIDFVHTCEQNANYQNRMENIMN